MSKRNSQDAKRAARERLRVEREQQAKKDKRRRQLGVAGAVVAILAIAGGIGYAVTQMGSDWDKASDGELVVPEHASGENGTTVLIGDESAEKTLHVYEDMRCPACAAFEQSAGATLKEHVADGKYQVSYTMATFIDDVASGEGSKNSLSALGAALDVSEDAFMEYKYALYSAENHPQESLDEFAKDDYLLDVAQEVDALKDNAEFERNVEEGTFDRWALEMSEKFDDNKDGVTGTPSFVMDGEKLEVPNMPAPSPEQFTQAVEAALEK
ncbi:MULTISPECIES: thioredoxin domain-containing protein [Streptomyces]|uniref:thioredoxin domain-containing protein n=1 Tax=Streptomyces TaxID=1883 RepID=UPI002249241A|nr:thioredoxin domain-containing protein [Streptomyces sp. JHD 1]MCX2969085.1 thioredoxin domain-containing protein [Streptomyces sp. JHD 1]